MYCSTIMKGVIVQKRINLFPGTQKPFSCGQNLAMLFLQAGKKFNGCRTRNSIGEGNCYPHSMTGIFKFDATSRIGWWIEKLVGGIYKLLNPLFPLSVGWKTQTDRIGNRDRNVYNQWRGKRKKQFAMTISFVVWRHCPTPLNPDCAE